MSKHTPGPLDWIPVSANASGGYHIYIIDAVGRKIAALWGKAEEKRANAYLFSAAPEMLKVLKEAEHLYTTYGLRAETTDCGRWINEVRAIIAKATGETP